MISVLETYSTLVEYCNKDQKGFVTPKVFNAFAALAQKKIYNSFFSSVATAKGVRMNQTDGSREFSADKYIKEDLSRYIRKVRLEPILNGQVGYTDADGGIVSHDNYSIIDSNVYKKPSDMSRIISVSTPRKIQCELVYNDDDINNILRSNLSRPSVNFPVALVGKDLEIFPKSNPSDPNYLITLSYYRQPRSIYVTGYMDISAGDIDYENEPSYVEVGPSMPDIVNCRDFDLPEHYKAELIETIAGYIGIRLRDSLLVNKPQQ